jgi:membrane peptidoglycan carboxypeptidase
MIGYTPSISVGAWMGNNDNTPMAQQASARIIGPMWKKIMDHVLEQVPVEEFESPDPIEPNLKSYLRGVWQNESGEVHSELYWVDRSNIKGSVPGLGSNDPLFRNFEVGVNSYSGTFPVSTQTNTQNPPTTEPSSLKILTPFSNSSVGVQDRIYITVGGTKESTTQVQYFINNNLIGSSNQPPYSFSFIPGQTPGIEDENEIKAVFMDNIGKSTTATTFFSIIR